MTPAERADGHSLDLFVPLLVSSRAGKSSEPTQADCLPMTCGPAQKGSRANQIPTSGIWTKNAEAFRQLAVGWRTGTHWKVLHGRVWAAMWGETKRRPGQEKVGSERWDSREDGEQGGTGGNHRAAPEPFSPSSSPDSTMLPFSWEALFSLETRKPECPMDEGWPPCRMGASGLKETWFSVQSGFAEYSQGTEGWREQGTGWPWWSAASWLHLSWSKRKVTLKAFTQLNCASECMHACSALSLCDLINCSLPVFSVHGIFRAGILEQVAISYSRG